MVRRLVSTAAANLRADPSWRECLRLVAGLPILRANAALFVAAVLLPLVGVPPAWPHEAPIMWAIAWLPAYLGLAFVAEWAGVDGMRDPDTDDR
ncbi:hypothetical protein [Methylorubrum thiocyanatum]|uniref:hypothetical protein n=1 Tax=Methylorubrum thiocyanatum TaxID=47958 RepID=UPI0035C80094